MVLFLEKVLTNSKFINTMNNDDDQEEFILTSQVKWAISLMIGALFIIISYVGLYKITGYISGSKSWYNGTGPSLFAMIIHGLIFTLIIRFIID